MYNTIVFVIYGTTSQCVSVIVPRGIEKATWRMALARCKTWLVALLTQSIGSSGNGKGSERRLQTLPETHVS